MSRPPNVGIGELSTIAKRNSPSPPKCRTSAAIPCGRRAAGLTKAASVSRSRTVNQRYDTTFSVTSAVGSRQSAISRMQKAGVAQIPPSGPAALQRQSAISTMQPAVASRKKAIHNLLFTIHHLQFLYFQQYCRFQRVTTFVFYNIPARPWAAEGRSFVFIDIPASFVHFLRLLVLSFPLDGDSLS